MSYKYSKGPQIIGDLSGSDDANRNTGIDFEEDFIGFETSGSMTMVVSGSKVGIGTITPDYELDVAGDIGVNQYIYHNGDANTWINFTDNRIRLNAGGNNFIDCEDPGSAPHKVRINNGGNNIDFVIKDNSNNVYFTADASTSKVGIGTDTPSHKLDIDGDIRVRGNDIRDNSGNPAISFDGSSNTSIAGNLSTNGGYIAQLDVVSSSPFTVTSAHHYLAVDTTAQRTINLPSTSSDDVGRILTIFDAAGRANISNIGIVAAGGEDISGNSTYVINTAGGAVTIICASSGAWVVINKVT